MIWPTVVFWFGAATLGGGAVASVVSCGVCRSSSIDGDSLLRVWVVVTSPSTVINPPSSSSICLAVKVHGGWVRGVCVVVVGCLLQDDVVWWLTLQDGFVFFLTVVFRFVGCRLFVSDGLFLLFCLNMDQMELDW